MKVRLLSVGKDKSGLFQPAVDEYADRLSHYCKFDLVELPAKGKDAEAQQILSKKQPREWLVALDERGELLTSVELSAFVGKAQREGADLLFVVGGDEGLADTVRRSAKRVLGLSRMTLPHRMARAVIAEQLYRAFTLLKGEPYHK